MSDNPSKKTICIIPARGGSKGVPGKNIIDFCGKPLLAWSIIQASNAKLVDSVYVSSDSDQILATAKQFGATPVKRPSDISGDTAASESALLHCLEHAERESPVRLVVFLQATSPLRTAADIDNAIETLEKEKADSLFSMSLLTDACIWLKREGELQGLSYDPENRGRRQERQPLFLENGSIYVFKPESLKRGGNRIGGKIAMYEMEQWKSGEIDSYEDIEICEWYFKNKLSGGRAK